jgi:tyrosine-specific transport protein
LNKSNTLKTLTAILLVAGTSIGGGMLALPLGTGIAGFLPSLLIMALCCVAMTASGLLLIEASLWFEEGAHIHTMTSRILGPVGKAIAWVLYLYICYVSLVAYTSGGGKQIAHALNFSNNFGSLIFIAIFGAVIILGSRWIGRINAILFGAMLVAYFMLIGMGVDEVKPQLLTYKNFKLSWIAFPLLLTTFSYQTMVPSLTPYLNRNKKALRTAVIGGNLLTFFIYALFLMVILGIIPVFGENGLIQARDNAELPTYVLSSHVTGPWVWQAAEFFAFFAIATSFLGISFGLIDFLSDGLHLPEKRRSWVSLIALVLIPTLFFAIKYNNIFLIAMEITGGVGDSILNGIIPVLMIWLGRYHLKYPENRFVPGGKLALAVLLLFFLMTLVIEILSLAGWVVPFYEPYDLIQVPDVL